MHAHRIRFTGAGLSIGQYGAKVALQQFVDERCDQRLVQLLLANGRTEDRIEHERPIADNNDLFVLFVVQ